MAAKDEFDVCDNWEDMDEIGLDKRLSNFLPPEEETSQISRNLNGCNVVLEENTVESQFMNQEPSIKILKRPPTAGNGFGSNEMRSRPVKTLEQRKKEYQEARLRILGEAKNPEDCLDDKIALIEDKLISPERVIVQERPTFIGTTSELRKSPPGVLILRTPRAPDGTKGFAERR